jgi:glucan phosphoethanolaminetransferase (alkaline phosphatase superfamily)
MQESIHTRVWSKEVGTLLVEWCLWFVPAAGFLTAYVHHWSQPSTAVGPHLWTIGAVATAFSAWRLALAAFTPVWWTNFLAALLGTAMSLALVVFYSVCAVSLSAWGKVPTWLVLRVYAWQWRDMAEVLGINPAVVAWGVPVIAVGLFALFWVLLPRLGWAFTVARPMRKFLVIFLVLYGTGALGLRLAQVWMGQDRAAGDPLTLMVVARSPAIDVPSKLDQQLAQPPYTPSPTRPTRNVIMVVGDALRPDKMSLFGYSRPTTPWLSAMAQKGRLSLASQGAAVCAESFCGLMGIARSHYAHEQNRPALSLGTALNMHGYRTWLMLSGDHTNFFGLADALGPADLYWDGLQGKRYVNDDMQLLERVQQIPDWDGTPTFLQLHLMSTHALGRRHASPWQPTHNYYRLGDPSRDVKDINRDLNNFYDNGMLQFDGVLQKLLEALQSKRWLDDALVIVTGDHGEMLGELNKVAHGRTVLQPVLTIPLVLMRYGHAGQAIEPTSLWSQIDIAPTVLHDLGLPLPAGWSGRPLHLPMDRQFVYFQQHEFRGVFDLRIPGARMKYWWDKKLDKEYLYDVIKDPKETTNLIDSATMDERATWRQQVVHD